MIAFGFAFAVGAKRHGDRPVEPARDAHLHPLLAKLDDAGLGEAHRLAVHLLGDGAAPHIAHMVDRRGDRDQRIAHLADRLGRLEAFGKFLGDELGGEPPLLPPLVPHQHGKEGNVVAEAVDGERIERAAHLLDGLEPLRRMRDQLGDHRVVIDADLAPLLHA